MKDIETLEAVADLIKAQGGQAFCSGYIHAARGGDYEMPNLIDYANYLRGYLSAANREQLDKLAGAALPLADFTGCDDDIVKLTIMGLIE